MPVVQLPNGQQVQFPEGVTPDQMTGALRRDFPAFFKSPTSLPSIQDDLELRAGLMGSPASTPAAEALPTPPSSVRTTAGGPPVSFRGNMLETAGEALLDIPRAIGTGFGYAGELARAGVADIAANVAGSEFAGNIPAAVTSQELPVDVAIAEASQEQKERGELGIATISARASQGLAKISPKLAALPAVGGGLLVQSLAAGGLFGLDDEGNFHPKEAVIASLIPGVGAVARSAVGASLSQAIKSGSKAAANPTTQKLVELAADNAAVGAYLVAASSPELARLSKEDPDEFRKHLGEIVATQLGFGLLGLKNLRAEIPSQTQKWIEDRGLETAARMLTDQTYADFIDFAARQGFSPSPPPGVGQAPSQEAAPAVTPSPPSGERVGVRGQAESLEIPQRQQEIFKPLPPPPPSPATSGIGFPMVAPGGSPAAPVPATPPPAPAPGVTMIQGARLPVTLPRTAPGSVSVPQIMGAMQRVLRTAGSQAGNIRTGHFFQRALGIWKPHEEIIRMTDANNIPTATHEIGHGLQQKVYGTAMARGLKFLGPDIRRELIGLGKALYGGRKPTAGYSGEGFAEFMRYWITTEDAPKVAPKMTAFFEKTFLPTQPAIAKSLADARDLVSIWRAQGSVERAGRQIVREPGTFKRIADALAKFVGYQAQFESGAPLEAVSREAARKLRRPLRPSEDPYKLFSWKRGSAGATVERMANEHMLDVWGNPVGPSLAEALAPVKGQRQEFLLYLFSRRALERWSKNQNPGIALEDAQYIKTLYDKPEFQVAAKKYYDWWDGLLNYVVQADPSMRDVAARIKAGSTDYAPLARMIDPAKAKAAAAQAKSNPLIRMHGSGLPVKDIFDQTFINAARLVTRANRALVTNALVKLSRIQGLGHIAEAIPRDRVSEKVNIEQIRKQLEDLGVDTSAIPTDEILQYYTAADTPKGTAPIVVVKDSAGKPHWYEIDPRAYDTLEGLQTFSLKQSFPGIPYLGHMLDLVLGAPARAFRIGTTGLRPAFSLVTNPTRDLATLLAQTSVNPAKVAALYPAALADAIAGGPYKQAFYDLGAHLGQPLGTDIAHTKRISKQLFHGRILRVVRNPVDHLRELLSIPESAPRLAELRAVADEIGWKPGQKLTPDQAVQLALAAKRVTVDFSAAGEVSRILNQAIPFYNPALQGARAFARAFKNNPAKATLVGMSLFTGPALALWWANRDKEWYKALPWRERYLYSHIDDGTNVWQIPRPFEWGNAFMVIPEAIMDSWYRQDPEAATKAMAHIFETTNPADWPVLGKLAKEQWQNRIEFWDRPIVPRSEVDLPAREQVGPYTSRLAIAINKAFPEMSPRRVDAAIRGYFGGAGTDLMQLLGLGSGARLSPAADRDWEASDFPVFGTIFRRGGQFNAQNQHINDFWDTYLPSSQAAKGLRPPQSVQMPAWADVAASEIGQDAGKAIRLLTQMAARTKETSARAELYRQAGEIARHATTAMRNARNADKLKEEAETEHTRGPERPTGPRLERAFR